MKRLTAVILLDDGCFQVFRQISQWIILLCRQMIKFGRIRVG